METYDAVLLHGYWLSQRGCKGRVRLSLRSRLSARAGALLHRAGTTQNLVMTVGHIWGADYPGVAQMMADELRQKYGVPASALYASNVAAHTQSEIGAAIQLAKKHGWQRYADVAPRTHHWTIRALYRKHGLNVRLIAIEDVIRTYDLARFAHLSQRMDASVHGWTYRVYEALKWSLWRATGNYAPFAATADAQRLRKGPVVGGRLRLWPQIDKFDL
jgi:hypothetical protein